MSSTDPITGLPVGWEIRTSSNRSPGMPYYYKPTTNESSWGPPPGSDEKRVLAYAAENYAPELQAENDLGLEPERQGEIRAAHLLIKHNGSRRPSSWKEARITRSKEDARAILEEHATRIKGGKAKLRKLAFTESDCSSASKNGDLGWFGRGQMQRPFEEAAFGLKIGQVSGIVETESGLHLIQRLN